jgi:hypothetical protein
LYRSAIAAEAPGHERADAVRIAGPWLLPWRGQKPLRRVSDILPFGRNPSFGECHGAEVPGRNARISLAGKKA